ncbi:uncharacterized protein CIMG_08780 [Coccidioides immitis RS]|uniref:Uncharacterized protein n=3 Tax=Coccidioides immitis TaxID=5501 RepID=A0A0E1RWA1_COCIM|nr:uncharacterized protein CIMG_08780 [Coccidioides immitis RS]EAS30034.1 hypothetical protein CIMG_08780 [Coccidioides immitis RS]KMU79921.1 hypothetical protein CISG_08203 [Coccidioides immitis RMSCC 3703]KMU86717.1 hypothetical protein CIHG_04506 [Coccidioides immitis H538.4]TPX22174.1 hypothetical protein DIZ76_014039 [Coccidioides immitis]
MHPRDPRIRQTINQISQNIESANETAQEEIYAFSHNYLAPCFASIRDCIGTCTASCFPRRDDVLRRRKRGASRGRAELNFDFYDDWDYDEDVMGDQPLGWGNDELDRLLAGSSGSRDQPRRNRRMSYGARGGRRKNSILQPDERQDPTVIPSSSFLGFLQRFPWRIGARGIRYRPSAADMQENPGGLKRNTLENEPLLEGSEESDENAQKADRGDAATRQRSSTQSSQGTSTSLSSRGDLILGDEEEDAVPLSDEFAMALERRPTNLGDESAWPRRSVSGTSISGGSRHTGKGKGRRGTRRNTTASKKSSEASSGVNTIDQAALPVPSIADLQREEEQVQMEEEMEIERKRQAAQRLARRRGLSVNGGKLEETPAQDKLLPSSQEFAVPDSTPLSIPDAIPGDGPDDTSIASPPSKPQPTDIE